MVTSIITFLYSIFYYPEGGYTLCMERMVQTTPRLFMPMGHSLIQTQLSTKQA